ncbi:MULTISPECIES: Rv2175c family DNA-binding protein [unclassified Schaalia]|uniref:Rv2175c family DNA-binding protein n=1 Tax=unclassified Schaalia TaxID=2691889 RepID=UPI001E299D8B|nr:MULTISPECIES: Rv2175c family DNA-binding protein [unclassified Schaalia]MCD4549495.1 transcriptional regulator [Schaalia sp. lx-260]MCD4558056.1 transcriptional regulator [Schaalia sp. lx-100]
MCETIEFLSVDEAARRLGVEARKIKQFVRDHLVLCVKDTSGKQAIPADMLVLGEYGWELLYNLPGTLTLLADGGFSPQESLEWLYRVDDELGQTPMSALREGRHHRVNAIASALAL